MFKAPEQFRYRKGVLGTTEKNGNNGLFLLPHFGVMLFCVCGDGEGWEHVSISIKDRKLTKDIKRCPTWQEMCYVKSAFWSNDEAVIQIHPKLEDYVDYHPFTLHLWKPKNQPIPLPPAVMVGPQE